MAATFFFGNSKLQSLCTNKLLPLFKRLIINSSIRTYQLPCQKIISTDTMVVTPCSLDLYSLYEFIFSFWEYISL